MGYRMSIHDSSSRKQNQTLDARPTRLLCFSFTIPHPARRTRPSTPAPPASLFSSFTIPHPARRTRPSTPAPHSRLPRRESLLSTPAAGVPTLDSRPAPPDSRPHSGVGTPDSCRDSKVRTRARDSQLEPQLPTPESGRGPRLPTPRTRPDSPHTTSLPHTQSATRPGSATRDEGRHAHLRTLASAPDSRVHSPLPGLLSRTPHSRDCSRGLPTPASAPTNSPLPRVLPTRLGKRGRVEE
jgi:hypothetical protein